MGLNHWHCIRFGEYGKSFQSALKTVKDNLPDDCISLDNVIPDWQEGLK